MGKTTKEPFGFKQEFHDSLDKLFSFINETTTKIEKVRPKDFQYGTCNTTYNVRFIKPTDISTFADNLVKMERNIKYRYPLNNSFAITSVKDFLQQNGCPPINDYSINTIPMHVNSNAQTLSDLILFVEDEMVKTSVYSASQISKRFESVQPELERLKKLDMVVNVKRVIKALPKIINEGSFTLTLIMMDTLSQFILFAVTLYALSLKSVWNYAFPKNTLSLPVNIVNDVRLDEPFVESCVLRSDPSHIALNGNIRMNKTNLLMMKERLPIDINIKNIVMQDQTKSFSDTVLAIKYILSDSRSPICHLMLKYKTDHRDDDVNYKTHYQIIESLFKTSIIPDGDNDTEFFKTNNNWLDLIVNGDLFTDHNYKRDTLPVNVNVNPILNTLDTIHRMYGEEYDQNVDLADNIEKVSNVMLIIIDKYSFQNVYSNNIYNRSMVRDTLIVLGEILTRNMLKLYWNNHTPVELNTNMTDTMSPAYIYKDLDIMESFVMEADNSPVVAVKNAGNKAVSSIKNAIKRFQEWVQTKVGNLPVMFRQSHGQEIKLVQTNKDNGLNAKIGENIGGMFKVEVDNFNKYDVPFKDLIDTASNLSGSIQKILDQTGDQPDYSFATHQSTLLPTGINVDDLNSTSGSGKQTNEKVRNYVLFNKQTAGVKPVKTEINKEHWDDIINNVLTSDKAIEKLASVLKDQFSKVSTMLSRQITVESIMAVIEENEKFFQEEAINQQSSQTTSQTTTPSPQTNNNQQPSTNNQTANTDTTGDAHANNSGNTNSNEAVKINVENSKEAQIFNNIVMPLATQLYTPMLNIIRNDFFAKSMAIYKGVVTQWNQQANSGNNNAQTNTSANTPTQ